MIEDAECGFGMTGEDLGLGFEQMKERRPHERTGPEIGLDAIANRREAIFGISSCDRRPAPVNQSLRSPIRKALIDCDRKQSIRAFLKQFGICNKR
jgi:hypothetical protein